jgi:hypothetical protein
MWEGRSANFVTLRRISIAAQQLSSRTSKGRDHDFGKSGSRALCWVGGPQAEEQGDVGDAAVSLTFLRPGDFSVLMHLTV